MKYELEKYNNIINNASSTLTDCREAIDEIDNILYHLLIKRIKISDRVAKIKTLESGSRSFFRVFREVEVIRNAYYALQDFYPKAFCVHIWRLFISALLNNERTFTIASENNHCYFMSREYFGSFIKNNTYNTNYIMNLLTSKRVDCGCFSFPSIKNHNKWWLKLINTNLKIFAVYPFTTEDRNAPVIFVADIDHEKTHSDTTLIAINSKFNSNYLQSILLSTNFSVSLIDNHQCYKLFSIAGFIDKHSIEHIKCQNIEITILGSFANPI